MQVFACPACSVKLKIPEGKSGRFNCPKCGKLLSIPAPREAASPAFGRTMAGGSAPPLPAHPAETQPHQLLPTDLLTALPAPDSLAMRPMQEHKAAPIAAAAPAWATHPAQQKTATPLKDFLTRLGIGIGILSGLLLVIGAVGIISEPIALIACFIGILAAIGLIAGGRIW